MSEITKPNAGGTGRNPVSMALGVSNFEDIIDGISSRYGQFVGTNGRETKRYSLGLYSFVDSLLTYRNGLRTAVVRNRMPDSGPAELVLCRVLGECR